MLSAACRALNKQLSQLRKEQRSEREAFRKIRRPREAASRQVENEILL